MKIGFFDSPIHEATAAVVTRVLEAHGITDIELVTGESIALIQEMQAGGIDLFIGLWLPDVHAEAIQSNPELMVMGNLYQPLVALALPNRMRDQVVSIEQLRENAEVNREIRVYDALYDIANRVLKEYDLFKVGYQLLPTSDESIFLDCQNDAALRKAEVMVIGVPGILADSDDFYFLKDPKDILSRKQKAVMVLNRSWVKGLGEDLIDELEEMMLGNQVVQLLETAMRDQGMDADSAAEAWQRGKLVIRA